MDTCNTCPAANPEWGPGRLFVDRQQFARRYKPAEARTPELSEKDAALVVEAVRTVFEDIAIAPPTEQEIIAAYENQRNQATS